MKKYIYLLICISLLLSGCSKSSEPVKGNPDPLIGVITASGERLTSKEDYERAILNVNGSVQADTEWGNIENPSGGLQQAAYDFGAKVAEVAVVKAIVEETLDNYTDETYSTEFHDSYGVVNIPDIDEEQADKYTQAFNIAASELGIEDYQITVNPVETVPVTLATNNITYTGPDAINNKNQNEISHTLTGWDLSYYAINTESNIFHYSTCRTLRNSQNSPHIIPTDLSRGELALQYKPCGVCKP